MPSSKIPIVSKNDIIIGTMLPQDAYDIGDYFRVRREHGYRYFHRVDGGNAYVEIKIEDVAMDLDDDG